MSNTSLCKNCNKSYYNYGLRQGLCINCRKKLKKEGKYAGGNFKFCSYCGEKIRYMAIKCRFCNEMLDINKQENTTEGVIKDLKKQNKADLPKEMINIKTPFSRLSIIGFVLSIISIFGIGLAGLIGFILGIVAMIQIRYKEERGKGLAISAIIIGFIWSFGVGILRRLVEMG